MSKTVVVIVTRVDQSGATIQPDGIVTRVGFDLINPGGHGNVIESRSPDRNTIGAEKIGNRIIAIATVDLVETVAAVDSVAEQAAEEDVIIIATVNGVNSIAAFQCDHFLRRRRVIGRHRHRQR